MTKVIALAMALAISAMGQTPVETTPQSVTSKNFLNAVTAAVTSGCLPNVGQTVHISNYTVSGTPTFIQFRLEYSYNSDPATCTTGTWFQLSDDSTDLSQGEVVGIASYPFIRANLIKCVGCGGGVTFTASYSGTSSAPGVPYGFYNPSQQVRKVVFANQPANADANSLSIAAPYGSSAGWLVVIPPAAGFSNLGATFTITNNYGGATMALSSVTLPSTSITPFILPQPATPATSLSLSYSNAGGPAQNFSVYYYFLPPGSAVPSGIQPPSVMNSQGTALNATVQVPYIPARIQNVYIFSVNAHCSAGTATLTIVDVPNAATVWSSSVGEVGTTTFKFQWNPGFLASVNSGDEVDVRLSTCGAGNTGTLDSQGSVL